MFTEKENKKEKEEEERLHSKRTKIIIEPLQEKNPPIHPAYFADYLKGHELKIGSKVEVLYFGAKFYFIVRGIMAVDDEPVTVTKTSTDFKVLRYRKPDYYEFEGGHEE